MCRNSRSGPFARAPVLPSRSFHSSSARLGRLPVSSPRGLSYRACSSLFISIIILATRARPANRDFIKASAQRTLELNRFHYFLRSSLFLFLSLPVLFFIFFTPSRFVVNCPEQQVHLGDTRREFPTADPRSIAIEVYSGYG